MISADDRLIVFVRSCRRRLVLAAFVRFSAYAAGALAIVVTLMAIWRVPEPLFLLAAALTVPAAGAAAAWLLTPTMKQTAQLVDRRHRLEDSLTAALQVRAQPSPISELIVKQSADRIAGVLPARAIPLGIARPVAAAAIALGVAAAAVSLPRSTATTERRGGIRLASNSGGRPSPETSGNAETSAPRNQPSSQRTGSPAQAAAADAQRSQGDSTQPPPTDSTPSPTADSGRPAATEPPGSAGAPAAGNGRMGMQAGTGQSDSAPGKSATSSSAQSGASGAGAAPGAGRGGGAQAAGGAYPSGAGGVRQGPVIPARGDGVTAVAGTSLSAGLPPGGQRHESAITSEEVPARLRPYVRSYFQAIRP